MVAVWAFDLFAAVVLASTALIGAYIPVLLSRKGKITGERSLSFILGNMLSAGVMIAAGFCHLLGDAIEQLTRSVKYPLAPFLCACGFMSTLIADQIVEAAHSRPPSIPVLAEGELQMLSTLAGSGAAGASPHGGGGHSHGGGGGHHHCFGAAVQQISSAAKQQQQQQQQRPQRGAGGDASGSQRSNGDAAADSDEEIRFGDEADYGGRRRGGGGLLGEQRKPPRAERNGHYTLSGSDADSDVGFLDEELGGVSPEGPARSQVSFLTACLMGVALTFHSLLEGAALGAQEDVVNSLHIFIAIQAHKGLAAYALGSSIVDSDAEPGQFWSVIATFALATPIGIGIGVVLAAWTTSNGAAAVSALASGTFLYVAFMEVLPRELSDPRHRLAKLGMLILGFGLMALLAIWA